MPLPHLPPSRSLSRRPSRHPARRPSRLLQFLEHYPISIRVLLGVSPGVPLGVVTGVRTNVSTGVMDITMTVISSPSGIYFQTLNKRNIWQPEGQEYDPEIPTFTEPKFSRWKLVQCQTFRYFWILPPKLNKIMTKVKISKLTHQNYAWKKATPLWANRRRAERKDRPNF